MKNSQRKILTLLLLLASALCLIFAACGGGVKLSFETNCDASIEAITAEVGEEVTLPTPAEREGYTFEGWYDNSDFSGDPIEKTVAESDKTFYAKWTQVFTVTLDVGAGQLSTTKVNLKAGENIANGVKDLIPTRNGFEFGEWLMGNAALSSTAVMPSENVTLTAHYKVGYTVHVYKQNLAQTDYEAGDDITGYAYPAKNYTPAVEVNGFKVGTHDGELKTKDLSETPSENVYTFYLDRQQYTVTLLSNYPEGGEARREIEFLYGAKVTLPYDLFSAEGYLLSGWSRTTSGGIPEYPSNAINGLILNGDGKEYKDEFEFTSDITLYAIWQQGYRDLFGGGDTVFHLSEDADYVILQRLGNYYRGNYNALDKSFDFENSEELSGKLFDNGFIYYDESRDGRTYLRYWAGNLLNETVSLDAYNGIRYTQDADGSPVESLGTYFVDEDGYYIAEYTSGPLEGSTVKMLMGAVQASSTTYIRVFMACNEEEAERGEMIMFGIIPSGDGEGQVGTNQSFTITLDGFGNALVKMGETSQSYIYQSNGDIFVLYSSSGQTAGTFKFMSNEGREGFSFYESALDNTFTSADGATLELDGAYSAIYTSETVSMTGRYRETTSSIFGGTLITFYADNGNQYVYRVYSTTVDTGAEVPVQSYYMEEKKAGYAEYRYTGYDASEGATMLYPAPLLVIDDAENCKASIYGLTTGTDSASLVKVAEGTYEYNEQTDTFAFTVTNKMELGQSISDTPIDILHLKSFVYSIISTSNGNVAYWHSATYEGTDGGQDTTTNFEKQYKGENDSTLTLVSGFAIYTEKDEDGEPQSLIGVYSGYGNHDNIIYVSVGGTYLFFELQEDEAGNKTFLRLDSLLGLGTVREITPDGYVSNASALVFDGKGNATLTTVPEAEEGQEEPAAIVTNGTYEETDRQTMFEAPVYHFTPEGDSKGFDFIVLTDSNGAYFARFNDAIPTRMTSSTGETLTLDGYSFMAEYTSPDMEGSLQGYYFVDEGNVIEFQIGSRTFYFDIDPDAETFKLRGLEAATYFYIDNQYMNGLTFEFDGYGKATIKQFDLDNGGEPIELGVGEYSYDDDVWTVEYTSGADHHIYVGYLALYPISSTQALNVFIKEYEDVVRSYIDVGDWSVLTPDSLGNAELYTATGLTENGMYIIISDDLMYYSGSDECLYRYSNEKGTIEKIVYRDRGYYAEDLRALQFSSHGFMIMDGETSFFYTLDEQGNITTYEQDPSAEGANKYGFVINDKFGTFGDSIVIGDVTYHNNNGIPIRFTREEATKNEYPVAYNRNEDGTVNKKPLGGLIFQPTGAAEFVTTGSVEFDGEQQSCTFVRTAVYGEDGETVTGYEFYVLIANYRFYIEFTYAGAEASTYRITAMRSIISAYNNSFYEIYPLIAMFYGEAAALSLRPAFGHITATQEFSSDGEISTEYIDADLGVYSVVTLLDGNTVTSLEHVPYERRTSSNAYVYTVEYTGSDEESYKFYFLVAPDSNYGYVYLLHACTRVQKLSTDQYEVEVERTVIAENYSQSIFSVSLKEKASGTECEYDELYLNGNTAYCVVRTRNHLSGDPDGVNTGRFLSSVYYIVTFTDKEIVDVGGGTEGSEGEEEEEETAEPIPLFDSVTIEKHETKVIYDESGTNFVEIEEGTDQVFAFVYYNRLYFVESSVYDEANTTYTVTLAGGTQVTIKITTNADDSKTAEIIPVQSSES